MCNLYEPPFSTFKTQNLSKFQVNRFKNFKFLFYKFILIVGYNRY